MERRTYRPGLALTACVMVAVGLAGLCLKQTGGAILAKAKIPQAIPDSSADPRLVYSDNPDDSWNRIFRSLFTRSVKTRLSDAFPEGAPFTQVSHRMGRIRASTRTFERFENGDRPIDPLYPSFINNEGVLQVLTEPRYSELKNALIDALADHDPRPPINRVLMQSDAWAAYDILFASKTFPGPDNVLLIQRRSDLSALLARFTKKIVLTPEEIHSLADNYADSTARLNLPTLFATNGEWIELQMSPGRLHDVAADYRRSARVFLKPADRASDKKKLLEELRHRTGFSLLDSVALVMQNMLIDSEGRVIPSRLTIEIQIRRFVKDDSGKLVVTELHQYELSRRSLLSKPAEGGLLEIDKNADLYLPAAGNDYQFASPQFTKRGNDYPVLVSLRQRCEGCHGTNAALIFTLSSHYPLPLPPITLLLASDNVHGWYVAGRKQEREDFKSLRMLW